MRFGWFFAALVAMMISGLNVTFSYYGSGVAWFGLGLLWMAHEICTAIREERNK